jgi:hypothetical protein
LARESFDDRGDLLARSNYFKKVARQSDDSSDKRQHRASLHKSRGENLSSSSSSAVDGEGRPRYETSLSRGQIEDRLGDLINSPDAFQRVVVGLSAERIGTPCPRHVGVGDAWGNAVDAHVWRELARHRPRQVDDRALGRAIDPDSTIAAQPSFRSNIDDRSARRPQGGQRGATAEVPLTLVSIIASQRASSDSAISARP